MSISSAHTLSARCEHDWSRPKGFSTKKCNKCGVIEPADWREVPLQDIIESEGNIQILRDSHQGLTVHPKAVAYPIFKGNGDPRPQRYVMADLPPLATGESAE